MAELHYLKIESAPSEMNMETVLDSFLYSKFMMVHEPGSGSTYIAADSEAISNALNGLGIYTKKTELTWHEGVHNFKALAVYMFEEERSRYNEERKRVQENRLTSLYSALRSFNSRVFFLFSPSDSRKAEQVKKAIESDISAMEVRATKSPSIRFDSNSYSTQMEIYHNSDKKRVLISMLDMLNDILMSNGTSYQLSIFIEDSEDSDPIYRYLRSKMLVLEEKMASARSMGELYSYPEIMESVPFSIERCSGFIFFSERIRKLSKIKTPFISSGSGIEIGSYMRDGIKITEERLNVARESLNLGCIISGLPGYGKTASAKNIIGQVAKEKNTKVVIISPNDEWNAFGQSNGLDVVKVYDSSKQINFFKCDNLINVERFYEDLSMLIASASNAGPYKNSIEKVLLSAFNKSYKESRDPDPNAVYSNIELAVIEQHGKVTNASVRYTKHGENIRAALQNLRLIISRPEFAYNKGIDFRSIIERGAVFDLSKVSNNMKPFFYALILNQVYGFAESFDIYGDNELRMLICLEEAQVVFSNDSLSAANQDLENRIQNFRKKGIGLFLITHNATDISPRIRRLLQFKMYFRQSADVAKYAANDLIFSESDELEISRKLKLLGQRECAVSYIGFSGNRKIPESSVFVQISEIKEEAIKCDGFEEKTRNMRLCDTLFTLFSKENAVLSGARADLMYFGEKIAGCVSNEKGELLFRDMLSEKQYELIIIGEKKKDSRRFLVYGGRSEKLTI
jgi:hypothetical protein